MKIDVTDKQVEDMSKTISFLKDQIKTLENIVKKVEVDKGNHAITFGHLQLALNYGCLSIALNHKNDSGYESPLWIREVKNGGSSINLSLNEAQWLENNLQKYIDLFK